ncbi:hypothetical protein ACW9HQ_43480, partial [Nocardia gipuzkoensis]
AHADSTIGHLNLTPDEFPAAEEDHALTGADHFTAWDAPPESADDAVAQQDPEQSPGHGWDRAEDDPSLQDSGWAETRADFPHQVSEPVEDGYIRAEWAETDDSLSQRDSEREGGYTYSEPAYAGDDTRFGRDDSEPIRDDDGFPQRDSPDTVASEPLDPGQPVDLWAETAVYPSQQPAQSAPDTTAPAPQGTPIYQRMVSEWLVEPSSSGPANGWSSPADAGWAAAAEA